METNDDDSEKSTAQISQEGKKEDAGAPACDSGDYPAALRVWMNQLYQWQCFAATFPYFMASLHAQASIQNRNGTPGSIPNVTIPAAAAQGQTHPSGGVQTPQQTNRATQQQPNQQPQQQQQPIPQRGIEYGIPPLWKRLAAESIDFLLLFAIKLVVTFAAVDAFDLLNDLEKFDFENLGVDILADYKMALEMTSEILVLELIHRIGTCVFEALCLHRGSGGSGGATPGKKLLGLRVIRCEWAAPTLGERALVYPATDLGFGRALARSAVKNLSLTFLFPICFTLFAFQHNRTVYDIIGGSIVVEDRPNQRNAIRRNN